MKSESAKKLRNLLYHYYIAFFGEFDMTFFGHNYFYSHLVPTVYSSRAVVSYWHEHVHFVLVSLHSAKLPKKSLC